MQNKLMRYFVIFVGVGLAIYLYYGISPNPTTGQMTTVTRAALVLTYSDTWLDTTGGFDCSTTPVAPPFNGIECLLRLVDTRDRTNINILRYATTLPFTVDMMQELFIASGGEIVSVEVVDLNGTPALVAETALKPSTSYVRQLSTFFNGGLYIITAFATDKETYDAHRSEIEAILDSVQLKP